MKNDRRIDRRKRIDLGTPRAARKSRIFGPGTVVWGVALAVALVGGAFSPTVYAAGSIVGTAHDFSGKAWAGGEVCKVCHTPHNSITTVTTAPLWNHSTNTVTYTVYSSPTMKAVVGQPDGSSKLCLTCHDGTLAVDSFGGATGTTMITAANNVGTALGNDHPVSFTYDAALLTLNPFLKNPTTALSGLGCTITANLLQGNKVQCSSCHDVHNAAGVARLLVKSNTASALCLTCHNR